MKLPKEDIQFIDNYLKNSGVTLVDVRLEMVDHIASDIERKLENKEEENFYDAFKKYMINGKKALLDEYDKERERLTHKVLIKTLKTFLEKDVLLVGVLCCLLVFEFRALFVKHFDYTLLLLIPATVLYYILFKGVRRTSIAVGLGVVLVIPLYLGMYVRSPYVFLYLVGVYLLWYFLLKEHYDKVRAKKHKLVSIVFWYLILLPGFYLSTLYKESLRNPNEIALLFYYAFQLTHWYVVFKQIFRYKKELDTKYKMLLGA